MEITDTTNAFKGVSEFRVPLQVVENEQMEVVLFLIVHVNEERAKVILKVPGLTGNNLPLNIRVEHLLSVTPLIMEGTQTLVEIASQTLGANNHLAVTSNK